MSGKFFFYYQRDGVESAWELGIASERQKIVNDLRPAFTTVLDLSGVPDDNDWSKVRYRGPFYADFDADDVEEVCEGFKTFLGKLSAEFDFDLSQARIYATGGRGFHIEIPQACFIEKVPAQGSTWLAYVYREMAKALMVDTLDLNIFTGKRGRQWRTPGVKRDNGAYKVPLTLEEALSMTPELYEELVRRPRSIEDPTPPSINAKLMMLFQQATSKVTAAMRGKKKRQDAANAILDPWKRARKTPPTIEMIMRGENINDTAGFQALAMQLAIYATSVGLERSDFIGRCQGLIDNHVSDSRRYSTQDKRRAELGRMWDYMSENTLYEFDAAPVIRLLKPGVVAEDLGQMDESDPDDVADEVDGDDDGAGTGDDQGEGPDPHKGLRKGFIMNSRGMFRRRPDGEGHDSLCRATFRNPEALYHLETLAFSGYEFDLYVGKHNRGRVSMSIDTFSSSTKLRSYLMNHQIGFQGNDADAVSLMDAVAERAAKRGGKTFFYPREGFFVTPSPIAGSKKPILVYLTKDQFMCSEPPDSEHYFKLHYRPTAATSSYNIDLHQAPQLDASMLEQVANVFGFNDPEIMASLLGWFVACHYRSLYLRLFHQFPIVQIFGEAGSGKTQTVKLLAHLHWYVTELISMRSAMSPTSFALEAHASSSTSAPLIIDEYKPRELRTVKGKHEKIKDILKASYVGGDIGERGTVNKGAENTLALIKHQATAPIIFMSEALEMETAIIERSIIVNLSKAKSLTPERIAAFNRLQEDPTVLSSIGRAIVEAGFGINLDAMRDEVTKILRDVESRSQIETEDERRLAPRLVYNRAISIHGLTVLKRVLQPVFGNRFDENVDMLINAKLNPTQTTTMASKVHAMSEISKVMSRIALLSRDIDAPWEMRMGKDYLIGNDTVEIKVERAYDCYRRYCASIHDTPLFDTLESFIVALDSYTPAIDRKCLTSDLRGDDTSEHIVRFAIRRLKKEGVQDFRS